MLNIFGLTNCVHEAIIAYSTHQYIGVEELVKY